MHILEVESVTRCFGGLVAVSRVSFSVRQGEIVGLIGPNGAGKTTVFNLISGALVPDAGTVKFKGRKISGLKPHQICRLGVARTFQAVKIFPGLTVYENVLMGALFGRGAGAPRPEAEGEVRELLDFVGLADAKDAFARDLTLVSQKRLEVARALATRPELLLLDELMAGLNPTEVSQAMDLVLRIRQRGITVLLIEHVMKAIMNICERIIALHYGEKIAEGTPAEIAANRQVIETYLGEWR
ncbi:MAG: ABC transporter ATP-binding protein [Desulfotomaculales bacterium]